MGKNIKVCKSIIGKVVSYILVAIFTISCMTGCGKDPDDGILVNVKLTSICSEDIKSMLENNEVPESIRYTYEENGIATTYVTDDPEIIAALLKSLKEVRLAALELALVDPKVEILTFCGVQRGSNGESNNYDLKLHNGYFIGGMTYYVADDYEDYNACIERIKNEGTVTGYSTDIDELASNLWGYWFGETMEVSLFQDVSGEYCFYIFSNGNEQHPEDERIAISDITNEDGTYIITGTNENGERVEYSLSRNGQKLVFEDEIMEAAMME